MTDLLFTPQNNPGGVVLLQVAIANSFSNFPYIPLHLQIQSDSLVFKTGFRWFSVYGTDGTKQFSEPGKQADAGPVYEPSVRCFIPGDAAAIRAQLADWMLYPLMVKIEDAGGSVRLVGTPTQYLTLEVNYDTQLEMGGRRGTLLVFKGITTEPAAYLV